MKTIFIKKIITCGVFVATFCTIISNASAQTETVETTNAIVTETVSYNSTSTPEINDVPQPHVEEYIDRFTNKTRKGCLEDFRQCARKIIDNIDDGRGSNETACTRWKDNCQIHYPAIYKTIDETTEWTVITKKDFEQYQKLKEENRIKITVEKIGNKTITTKREIDDDGNEKITTTTVEETIEDVGNDTHTKTSSNISQKYQLTEKQENDLDGDEESNTESSDYDDENAEFESEEENSDDEISIIAG
ncbi:MAG: hypothetical protein LBU68_02550 [Rickettsiales bacterium]|jgi:hypothetical protein|nr:hypothetical protein [Rickettsiales bacterium]